MKTKEAGGSEECCVEACRERGEAETECCGSKAPSISRLALDVRMNIHGNEHILMAISFSAAISAARLFVQKCVCRLEEVPGTDLLEMVVVVAQGAVVCATATHTYVAGPPAPFQHNRKHSASSTPIYMSQRWTLPPQSWPRTEGREVGRWSEPGTALNTPSPAKRSSAFGAPAVYGAEDGFLLPPALIEDVDERTDACNR